MSDTAVKHDAQKDPWHLVPWDALKAIVKILAFGANKYSERNWENGFDWSRLYSATLRHLTAWWEGEALDPETGYSHLWHAGCCILFLIAHELRGIGKDDRPRVVLTTAEALRRLPEEAEALRKGGTPGQDALARKEAEALRKAAMAQAQAN